MASSQVRLLLVGFSDYFHIGAMLYRAALSLGIQTEFYDAALAYESSWLTQRLNWRLRGHRPSRLESFSQNVVQFCTIYHPEILLVTGMLPPDARALSRIRSMGTVCINYLTDDPWNPKHRAGWFMESLLHYSMIFSPRRANLDDLANIGCRAFYLPFGYDPSLHFPDSYPPDRIGEFECDVLFYGGADSDRAPYITSLIKAGYNIHLYGGYWNRYPQTRDHYKGMADIQTLRWAISGAKITLCLVRHANRDGHVMRTFEAPAMGACMLAEDTEEHRIILGKEGQAVVYFRTVQEMNEKVGSLLADDLGRQHLIENAHALLSQERNSYADRLRTMLAVASSEINDVGEGGI